VSHILLVLAFVGVTGFVVVFGLTVAWWRDEVLTNAFVFASCEAAILGLSLVAMLFGRPAWQQLLGFAAFVVFTVVAWWRLIVLVRSKIAEWRRR
jgi:hypothetical protein